MRFHNLNATLKTAILVLTVLLFGAGLALAQPQQVNLTAGATTLVLPDGSTVPMWGYTCAGATVITSSTATCANLNPNAPAATTTTPAGWTPVVITVPAGSDLQINLTNNLSFTPTTVGATANNIPTSLVIVGQVGGGLGTTATSTPSPSHVNAQAATTWPIAGGPGATPPGQGPRVQSFAGEVTAVAAGTAATCTAASSTPATGCVSLVWTAPRPGTYLLESGTHPSIQGPMGLYGIVVVTSAPGSTAPGATTTAGCAYGGVTATTTSCAVPYNAEVPLLFGEIDPVQNNAVNAAVNTSGFSETAVWSGQPGGCGNPSSATYNTCYPPAVNYTPLYYHINGVAFDKTHAANSVFATTQGTVTGTTTGSVLVRLVNAGLRMHIPSIVGDQYTPTGATTPSNGFALIAEDGNPLPGVPRVQSEVFMAAGKTYDVMINAANVPASTSALPVFDRQLSLSGNGASRDAGMLAFIGINGLGVPAAPSIGAAQANNDSYPSVVPCAAAPCRGVTITDPGKGLLANDVNVYGAQLLTAPTGGTVALNPNGTFVYTQNPGTTSDSFTYCANGSVTAGVCSSSLQATVTLGAATMEGANGITCTVPTFTSTVSTTLSIKPPGVLEFCRDAAGYPLTIAATPAPTISSGSVTMDPNGGFNATVAAAGTYTLTFTPQNSQGTAGASSTATLVFPAGNGPTITVLDAVDKTTTITDYRWIIEEDRTFYVDPKCQTNPPPAGCPTATIAGLGTTGIVPNFGTNFHTSSMPVVATGCVGPTGAIACESGQTLLGQPAVCDVGNGVCRTTASQQTPIDPTQVHLDPSKRYYISVLPGDAANPFNTGNAQGGHGLGGAPIAAACTPTYPATAGCTGTFAPVTVLVEPNPFQTAKLSVQVFEDDFPLNGEQDAGGGIDVLATNEPGLGGFQITLFDDAGGTGDATGQPTYDMFNMPLSNSLAGTIDPASGLDACPVSQQVTANASAPTPVGDCSVNPNARGCQKGITGMIVTCPTYESDGQTLSPLAGQAIVANLYPGRYGVVATPSADRIARGEEWLQTNTLDGQKAHDSFLRIGEPSYFQEYGPAGYHVSIGFANPATINSRLAGICGNSDPNLTPPAGGFTCNNTLTGHVTTERMSRTPDERLYGSGSYDSFAFTQCYVSVGDPDGEDFAFTKCDGNGNFSLSGLPQGNWRVVVFDQWNDMLVDGLSSPALLGGGATTDLGELATNQWQANIYTRSYVDVNGNGIPDRDANGNDLEPGLTLVPTNIRFRDGSFSNFNNTDLNGYAGFNEVFPLFSWYVIETDSTRYKNTGIHVVYDAGGPADGTTCGSAATPPTAPCGSSAIGANMANTVEQVSLPTSPVNLRVPGAVYCALADCVGKNITAPVSDPPSACTTSATTGQTTCTTTLSTGRIDPPWVVSEGWQGFSGQNSFIEFGKTPYVAGENGGIRGHVVYASTRPFDDPQLLLQLSWEPLVPGVTINLYQEGTAADGTQSLTLVDTTQTSSWDNWAQGFYPGTTKPYMNCPGQMTAPTTGAAGDLFYFSIYNQPFWLDQYNNVLHPGGTGTTTPLPNNSQFKCYDGMHNWNQVQPAPYDGAYQFPSIISRDPNSGVPVTPSGVAAGVPGKPSTFAGTNCTICVPNPTKATEPMLPAGKYVVEVVVPPGYELVKEEDKNILIGDNYIAPVVTQFGGLSNIFIVPDQAAVGSTYNANNAQNPTQDLGATPRHEGDTGSVESFWTCVGASRVVPDYISLYPQSAEVSPFAGATRNLCDRKEVTLEDQMSALAKFYIFTSAHAAAHFTGIITDDFTSEFDPFSPTWGEKFSPANQPVSIRDFNYNEISRVYSDQWGNYDGLTYSTWEVNPPNPTGYAPQMMVTCMNDAGPILDTTPGSPTLGQMITDPMFNSKYSQFCYEIPFMPGQTQYMDTPVVPTSAFVGAGYNNPDCAYPDATPAILSVTSADIAGPWVSAAGHQITINALGDVTTTSGTTNQPVSVDNYGYAGPGAHVAPFDMKTVTRHYGFGARCTAVNGTTCTAQSRVTIGVNPAGIPIAAGIVSWSDTQIVATVPTGVPNCAVQQMPQYGGPSLLNPAKCGELVITAGNGKQSVDAVTVTVGGKTPTVLAAGKTIQSAIDAAAPGDMIIVPPGTYKELLLMWKPVRLQGVGAASSVIDASTHPAGNLKMDTWRRSVDCLFGLAINGQPSSASNPFDSTGTYSCPTGAVGINSQTGPNGNTWNYFSGGPDYPQMAVDRLPREGILGWDTSLNGNLAEMLQEPSLMGAYEGAAITVLSKGVKIPANSTDVFGSGAEADFPTGSTLLSGFGTAAGAFLTGDLNLNCHTSLLPLNLTNPYPSNFICNPSSIDGLGLTNSSQGGGGILVHGWGHYLQIANNRINNNAGTLSGGISLGQGEFTDAYLAPNSGTIAPGSCLNDNSAADTNVQLPYCFYLNVNVHNNMITDNASTGDELFTGTPAGAGGVSVCTGADYYKFNYNWVCGNLSTGDGGGLGHLGFIYNGDIEHNSILFNQALNPTVPSNGGGILIMGAPPDGNQLVNGVLTECGTVTDVDCVPGLGDGAGPGTVVNANLIMGNGAEAGSGGGLRLQAVNGTEVSRYPGTPSRWYSVNVTNNIINNNVAGWDGAGISLEDSLVVNIVNNTVSSNDSTASAGVLFTTLGAPLASTQSPPPNCPGRAVGTGTGSCPQPAGLVVLQNSPQLTSSFTTGAITCPAGHYQGTTATNGTCTQYSYPLLANNVFWQNRDFYIAVGGLGTGEINQQNTVALFNADGSTPASQTATGSCPAGSTYWDIGARGDTGPGDHSSGITLTPVQSVLTNTAGYSAAAQHNSASNPAVVSQYCNGARIPPECTVADGCLGAAGYIVPPGIADATVPNPIFSLTPSATVDEGNNWINMSWGPLSMTNPAVIGGAYGNYGGGLPLGNYSLTATSPAINWITCNTGSSIANGCIETVGVSGVTTITAPKTDFFGNPRPDTGAAPQHIDVGAVEVSGH